MKILFVLGAPGVGKTSLVRRFLEPDSYSVIRPKWTVGERVCAAGHYLGNQYDGADTVPYNGVQEALRFWESELRTKELTIFDGDRFSNANVLDFFRRTVPEAKVEYVLLRASDEVLKARREERGSNQNPSWMKGRQTKAERFAKAIGWGVEIYTSESLPSSVYAIARTAVEGAGRCFYAK
jgi:hypothetical protein